MHLCISNLDNCWFRYWLVAWSVASHYLKQCWNIVNCVKIPMFLFKAMLLEFSSAGLSFFFNHYKDAIMCENQARISPMLVASGWFRPGSRTLWHGPHQAIIWTNDEILLIVPLGTNLSKILIQIHTFSFKKIHLKMSAGKWRIFCLGLNVLIDTLCANFVNTQLIHSLAHYMSYNKVMRLSYHYNRTLSVHKVLFKGGQ